MKVFGYQDEMLNVVVVKLSTQPLFGVSKIPPRGSILDGNISRDLDGVCPIYKHSRYKNLKASNLNVIHLASV